MHHTTHLFTCFYNVFFLSLQSQTFIRFHRLHLILLQIECVSIFSFVLALSLYLFLSLSQKIFSLLLYLQVKRTGKNMYDGTCKMDLIDSRNCTHIALNRQFQHWTCNWKEENGDGQRKGERERASWETKECSAIE